MDDYISINKIAELKGLKSTRSIRLAINQGKYIAREVEVRGGKSYEILYSSLEQDIQDRLDEEELKTTAIVPFENKVNFVSENARLLLMIGMVKRQVHKGKQLQATILMTDLKERSTLSKKDSSGRITEYDKCGRKVGSYR